MPEYAANFQKVIEYLGGKISFDREERYEMLEKLQSENENKFFDLLEKVDNFVYEH